MRRWQSVFNPAIRAQSVRQQRRGLKQAATHNSLAADEIASDAETPYGKYVGMSGADIVHEIFRERQVDMIFGYPGGAILPVFDAIHESDSFKFVLPRHEQGGGHMAEGYARVTGKPGVLIVTSGPGATNAVTPMQDALSDGIPLVVITGQVPTTMIGTDAFQVGVHAR